MRLKKSVPLKQKEFHAKGQRMQRKNKPSPCLLLFFAFVASLRVTLSV